MNIKNKFFFILVALIVSLLTINGAFAETADSMPEIDQGTVSGDAELISTNPWSTTGSLEYTIPDGVHEITSAKVIVNIYSGSGNSETYALHSNTTLNTAGNSKVLGYENLTYVGNQVGDPNVYVINNHTTKQYSDYQMVYDVLGDLKDLGPNSKIKIDVTSTPFEGKAFDGRIKMIGLFIAYNDGDNDSITYWLNVGMSWTQDTVSNLIYTKNYTGDIGEVNFEAIMLSSYNGAYKFNDNQLFIPEDTIVKDYYIYNKWNVTDYFQIGDNSNFTYSALSQGYGSIKSNVQLLKVINRESPVVTTNIASEYKNSIYAGVTNNLTITVNSINKDLTNVTVYVYDNGRVVGSYLVDFLKANSSKSVNIIDSFIRPIDENTVLGNNNTNVVYRVIVEDKNGILNDTNSSNFMVVYNGNLGKDLAYPAMNATITRVYDITGDVIILNKEDSSYLGSKSTNGSDTWNIDFKGELKEGLLYVSYNWNKQADVSDWIVTFNNKIITPIAHYRDQSNLGAYGKHGYGLAVYNVTDLINKGLNTFTLNKTSGLTAVYPSSLLLLTNNENGASKTVYMSEGADLLSKTNNKNLDVGAYTKFNIDSTSMINSTLYVFAAGGQKNEGNIVFNGEIKSDVWNKTSNSIDYYTFNTSGLTKDNNTVFFQSTGSTILALHQILVVERENTQNIKLTVENLEKYYGGSEKLNATLKDGAGNPIANKTITFTINGQKYNRTTNSNGIASLAINLRPGVYDVTTMYYNMSVYSNVVVKTTIESKDLVKMYQNGTQFFATFLGTDGKPLANNTKVTFNINGVFYTRQTNENGVARLNINLRHGEYILTAINPVNSESEGFNITVKSLIESSDLTKHYRNDSKFEVKIYNKDGTLAINKNVTFNINGVFYNRITDSNGVARLNINLRPGNYIITTIFEGLTIGNNINVLPTLVTSDLSMKYLDGSKFTAQTLDGQGNPLTNQNVSFNINGVLYQKVTDKEGIASLNITLLAGEYIITSYWNDFQVGNTIKID
ncbi:DUF3344 domain-containing protein [uncultured Methanobrevibacter sp.]|uniref:DUF3344 domain-containing protein n=1 Tax=uncultured Methanobrevibacter sp. TaxID=253161 RepID=UPI002590FD29|nr:DUF3344 domain-containing protein [uncultured Methanobrevibacter sp.]